MFRAYDPQRERLVAVKLFKLDLPPERVHQLVAALERLIAADLVHPVLAAPLAAGMTGVSAFLVQDYVAAESLDLAVREYGAVPPADALRVAAQLGGALDFGAVVDIFHGALHPRDVLLSTDETRLTGLGVARALEQAGVVAPVRRPYTAPERVAGGPWDRRADVFSLAALVHELLWGRRVSGTGRQAADGLTEIPGGDLETLRVVFTHALADEPADRFETGLEFAEALKQAFPDVVITGPSPTLNPRTPKRKARSQSAPPAASDEPIAPRLPLNDPEPARDILEPGSSDQQPVLPPVTASESVPSPAIEPLPPAPADDFAPPVQADAAVTGFLPEPLAPPLGAASFEPRLWTEEPLADVAIHAQPSSDERVPLPTEPAVHEPALASPVAPIVPPIDHRREPFSVLDQSRSAVWPLVLALIVGIALGFAAGYGLSPRDRVLPAAGTAGRDVTEGAAEPSKVDTALAAAVAAPAAAPTAPPPAVPTVAKQAPALAKAAAPPLADQAAGRMTVRSSPSGARVVVDGRDRGATPVSIAELARGPHRVQVMREGYATEDRRVVITRARPAQSVTVKLARERDRAPRAAAPPARPATGALIVESRPQGAQVFLDGKLAGVTPLTLGSVSAGDHAIHLDRGGYRRWSSSVRIAASESNRVTASLEK